MYKYIKSFPIASSFQLDDSLPPFSTNYATKKKKKKMKGGGRIYLWLARRGPAVRPRRNNRNRIVKTYPACYFTGVESDPGWRERGGE